MRPSRTSLRPDRWGLAAVVIGALTLGTLTLPTRALASDASVSHVSGAGVRSASSAGDVPFTFRIDATSNSTSGVVAGAFQGSFPNDPSFPGPGDFARFTAKVTCLEVSGSDVVIGGVVTSGYGYDDFYTQGQHDLAGDWFITTVQDPSSASSSQPDTMGYIDWGDSAYFASEGFDSFTALCQNPIADLGTSQFPLSSGDITVASS